ncbi:MAG: patatin family protein [Treponemataceae bacterium]|nr:patatin family protein [Treponemataceae bacterium]
MSEKRLNGIVMEGGAMRGMFTAGVIDVFMENGIEFDAGIGVSAGATFGCNLKSRQIGRAIRYNLRFCKDKRYCSLWSLIKTGDLYGADFCYNKIPNELDLFDLDAYRKNPMKFYAVVSDCITGQPIYKELPLCDQRELTWMRGSASMPLASSIVEVDGYKLLDGGMTDSIPLEAFEKLGYGHNIVVLTQPRDFVKKSSKMLGLMKLALKKYPKLYQAMEKRPETYNRQKEYVFKREREGDVFVIAPPAKLELSRTEHDSEKLKACYETGRKTALENLENIKKFLAQ